MKFLCKCLMLLLFIAAWPAAARHKPPFRPGPASSFRNHQTISKLTIAAQAFATREQVRSAFGKLNPNKYGILPILVVMQNDSSRALRLNRMRVEYIRPDHRHIDPIPAGEVRYLHGPRRPRISPERYPLPIPGLGRRRKKNPLANSEIEERAFAAEMLPPHDEAHGFFYFNTVNYRGATLYLTGIVEAATGQELFYFEIPLNGSAAPEKRAFEFTPVP